MPNFEAGSCFLHWDNSGKLHLHIVLTDASGDPPTVLTVPVNSANSRNTLHNFPLKPGDHGFIKHASVVNYSAMAAVFIADLDQDERDSEYVPYNQQMFRRQSSIDVELLSSIIDGALASRATPNEMKSELARRTGRLRIG